MKPNKTCVNHLSTNGKEWAEYTIFIEDKAYPVCRICYYDLGKFKQLVLEKSLIGKSI